MLLISRRNVEQSPGVTLPLLLISRAAAGALRLLLDGRPGRLNTRGAGSPRRQRAKPRSARVAHSHAEGTGQRREGPGVPEHNNPRRRPNPAVLAS